MLTGLQNHKVVKASTTGRVLAHVVFLVCLFPAAIIIFKKPAHNWDMLAYMALTVKMETNDVNTIHFITYNSAKENISPDEYKLLTAPNHLYRKKMAESPAELYSQLPYYVVKPLYIWSVYLAYKAGFNLATATVIPSLFSFLFIGWLLFYWLGKYLLSPYAFVTSLLLMHTGFVLGTARLSSPDMLSALAIFVSFYFVIERPNKLLLFFFLLISILIRIDNIITCFFIISLIFFSKKWNGKISLLQYLLIILSFTILYFGISNIAAGYGWDSSYYSSFLHTSNASFDFHEGLSLQKYLSLMSGAAIAGLSSSFVLFSFLSVLLIISNKRPVRFIGFSFDQLLILTLLFIILTRFVLFPDLSDRFYAGFYLLIAVILIKRITGKKVGRTALA